MNTDELTAIRERCDAATPGPWKLGRYTVSGRVQIDQSETAPKVNPLKWQRATICRESRENDATFIAHARADIPALLDEVTRLRAALEAVEWKDMGFPYSACPWCDCLVIDGHRADCQRQRALGVHP